MDNGLTGQLGVNYISMPGNIILGMQFSVSQDPDNPIFYPVSCGAGSQGGAITGGNPGRHFVVGVGKWPTK